MKTSEYTIEDLVQGAELVNSIKKIEIQGNIGKAYFVFSLSDNEAYIYTIDELKRNSYELIIPSKMNGEFEVKKYEEPYPVVKVIYYDNTYKYEILVEVCEDHYLLKGCSDSEAYEENNIIEKIDGQKY